MGTKPKLARGEIGWFLREKNSYGNKVYMALILDEEEHEAAQAVVAADNRPEGPYAQSYIRTDDMWQAIQDGDLLQISVKEVPHQIRIALERQLKESVK